MRLRSPLLVAMPALSFQSRADGVTPSACAICVGNGVPPAPNAMFGTPFSPSEALGVLQFVRCTIAFSKFNCALPFPLRFFCVIASSNVIVRPPLGVFGVGQSFGLFGASRNPRIASSFLLLSLFPAALFPFCAGVPAIGVGQCDPVKPLPLVWRVDGASRDIDRPDGVTFSLQISADSVEPTVARRARNLLSHDARGPTGSDKAE